MTIAQSDRVDGVGIDSQAREVVLLISDHLRWDDEAMHVAMLEAKIAGYIAYVRSNQHHRAVPESKGLPVRIKLVCEYQPTATAETILGAVSSQLDELGIRFTHGRLPTSH